MPVSRHKGYPHPGLDVLLDEIIVSQLLDERDASLLSVDTTQQNGFGAWHGPGYIPPQRLAVSQQPAPSPSRCVEYSAHLVSVNDVC